MGRSSARAPRVRRGAIVLAGRLPATVPRMRGGLTFIAVFVVSRDPGHELLSVRATLFRSLLNEGTRLEPSQRGGSATSMKDFHLAILSNSVGESEIVWVAGFLHWSCVGREPASVALSNV